MRTPVTSWQSRRTPWPDKFWNRVECRGPKECWPFHGAHGPYGHGKVKFNGHCVSCGRMAWILAVGDPGDFWVLHTCDNGACCNPAHLYLGGPKENGRDASKRHRYPDRRGEKHPRAKLTNKQVQKIRTDYRPRVITKRMLAARFGVAINTIKDVVEHRHYVTE